MNNKRSLKRKSRKYYSMRVLFILVFIFSFVTVNKTEASEKPFTIGAANPDTSKIIMGIAGSKVGVGVDPGSYSFNVYGNSNITGNLNVTGSVISSTTAALTGILTAGNISNGTFGSNSGGGNYVFPGQMEVLGSFKQNNTYRKIISLTRPADNAGAGKWYIRLQPATSVNLASVKVSVNGSWYYTPIMGRLEAEYSYYSPGNSTISNGFFAVTSAYGDAATNLRFGPLEIENGYISIPVWCANTNSVQVVVEYDGSLIDTNLTSTGWMASALPAANAEYIQSSLGVGTTNPGTKLDVTGDIRSSAAVYAAGANGFYSSTYVGAARNPIWRFANADTYGLSYFQGSSGINNADTIGFHFGTATAAGSVLQVNQGGTVTIPGNVGIGITNPDSKLMVMGGDIQVDRSYRFRFSAGNGYPRSSIGSDNNNSIIFYNGSNAEISRFDSNGSLGINTTNPGAYKLNVNGNTNITGSVTATSFSGNLSGTVSAPNISAGSFAANTGGGDFSFPNDGNFKNSVIVTGSGTNNGAVSNPDRAAILGFNGNYGNNEIGLYAAPDGVSLAVFDYITNKIHLSDAVTVDNSNLFVGVGTDNPGSRLSVDGDITQLVTHGNNMKLFFSAARNGGGTGDVALYSWVSEPGASWTGAGIARNMYNSGASFSRVNTALSSQMMHFTEGGNIDFVLESSGGTRTTPLILAGNAAIVAGGSSSNWASLNLGGSQSINANGSIYSYNSVCVGNGSGQCTGNGGVVIGLTNSAAATNIPGSGNTIFNNGSNVGIGITNPAAASLQVSRDIAGLVGYGTSQMIVQGKTDITKQLLIGFDTSNNYAFIQPLHSGVNWSDYNLALAPVGGNVGIGLTNPGAYKLNVNGNTNITGNLNVTGTMTGSLNVTGAVSSANISNGTFGSNVGSGNYTFPGTLTVVTSVTSPSFIGNASTATTFSTTRANYKGVTDTAVAGELMWKNYGNNHTIFDASSGYTPTGALVDKTNSQVVWSATYPTLMGWNGTNTFGVRVDSARLADNATNAVTAANSDTVDSLHASSFHQDLGWISAPGVDANSMIANRSGFTYSNNAPSTGPITTFGTGDYFMQLNAPYGNGATLSFRTKNGGSHTWNGWKTLTSFDSNNTMSWPAPTGDPSPTITSRVVPAGQGAANEKTELILFHANDNANGSGPDQITLRAPALSFQTYDNASVGDVSNSTGYNERMYINPAGNVGINTTNPIAKLEVAGGNNSSKIYKEVYAGQPDYNYYYLKLFKVPTGLGGSATTFDGKVCAVRSNDIGVSQCSDVYVGRGYDSVMYFSQKTGAIGNYGPFQLVKVNDGGYDWMALMYDTHAGAGIKNWTVDGMLYNENAADVISLTSKTSATAVHSALTYSAKNTAITEGNLGVGTNPAYKLQVYDASNANASIYSYNIGHTAVVGRAGDTEAQCNSYMTNSSGVLGCGEDYGVVAYGMAYDFYAQNTAGMSYFAGKVGIGTSTTYYKLGVDGAVGAAGFNYASDRSLKKNIATIESPLTKILQLRGVTFNWKKDNQPSVGLIAQEVEKVFPELVSEGGGIKSVQYGNLVAPLIEAVKEQQKQIDSLTNRINILESKK